MTSSIKLFGTALLFGAALTTAASAHGNSAPAPAATLLNVNANLLGSSAHNSGIANVTANVGNLVGAKVTVGGGSSLLGNTLGNTISTVDHTVGSTVATVDHTVGTVVNTATAATGSVLGTANAVLNNTSVKANVGNVVGLKVNLGGGVGSIGGPEHHGVGY